MTRCWRRFAPIDGVVVVLAQRARLNEHNNNINEMARMTKTQTKQKQICKRAQKQLCVVCLCMRTCVSLTIRTGFCLLLGHTAFNTSSYECVSLLVYVCVYMCYYMCLCATVAFALLNFHFFGIFKMHFIEFYTLCII